jgi:hypothetical protein
MEKKRKKGRKKERKKERKEGRKEVEKERDLDLPKQPFPLPAERGGERATRNLKLPFEMAWNVKK